MNIYCLKCAADLTTIHRDCYRCQECNKDFTQSEVLGGVPWEVLEARKKQEASHEKL
jgi:hypothetical protein